MAAKKKSQNQKVLDYMREHGSITSFQAFTVLKCTRLSARIKDLRSKGYDIGCTMISNINEDGTLVSYGEYYLRGNQNE